MLTKRGLLGLALPLVWLAGGGCDRPSDARSASTGGPTATQPASAGEGAAAAPAPDVRAAATRASAKIAAEPPQPVDTFMSIAMGDGQPPRTLAFPPAKVRLKRSGDAAQVVLYTDDPPAAASKDYRGNSYLFEMELREVSGPAGLDRRIYRYHADVRSAAERPAETTNGVFLNGWETHLQPADVIVSFEGRPPLLMARVVGTFQIASDDKDAPLRVATVQAQLPALIESK